MSVVHVEYVTDPVCPWSWAAEPAVRRVQAEFADEAVFTYVLGGLHRDIPDPVDVLRDGLEASAFSGMPVDPRGWAGGHGRAPRSSYPASFGVKAAAEQGLDAAFLREVREGFWVHRRPQDTPAALDDAATRVSELDAARFALDLRSNAIAEAFGADLDRARAVPQERQDPSATPPRAVLPTFVVRGDDAPPLWIQGRVTPGALRDAIAAAGAQPRPLPDVANALARFSTMTTAEVAACCDLPWPHAAAQLWSLALKFRARPQRVLGGELWHAA